MPGTKNRHDQPPANARVRRAAHLERVRELRARRTKSPERQARLHPSRSERDFYARARSRTDELLAYEGDVIGDPLSDQVDITDFRREIEATESAHPLPWRAPDIKMPSGWIVRDARGGIVEHASSRDKARARAKEVNGS